MVNRRLTSIRLLVGLTFAALLASSACSAATGELASQPAPTAQGSVVASGSESVGASPTSSSPAAPAPPTSDQSAPTTSTSSTPKSTPEPSTPEPSTPEPSTSEPAESEPTESEPTDSEPTESKPTESKPAAVMARGADGDQVRELQHRLRQLDWFSGSITGHYGKATVSAVEGFQQKRKLESSGEVDARTWAKLTSMTKKPSRDDMFNIVRPGKAIMSKGSDGDKVRNLQARLKQIAWYSGKVTGSFGSKTVSSVKGFQAKRSIPVTGEVDARTWRRLTAMTRSPSHNEKHNIVPKPSAKGLDSRCLTGRALCVSKRTDKLVWVIDGKPQLRVDVRFGSQELPTRNGSFRVRWKSRNHVSSIYHTSMPYAMFFSGGQAVHYSRDFAARGYAGRSHGCVNVRDRGAIRKLFDTVRVGDKVIVYT